MVTSVTMVRKLGKFEVLQRTKDGYFDANALLSQWNAVEGNPERKLSRFIESEKTKEFISELENELNSHSAKMHDGNNELLKSFYFKKGRNTSKGKTKDEVWFHPYLFIDFCMWINPKFKLQVIKFVYDELIQSRNLAGDNYKILSDAGIKLKGYNFAEIAKAIQWIVFGKIGQNLRQSATQDQLNEITDIQKSLAFAINNNLIEHYNDLLETLRKMYNKKQKALKNY